METAEVPIDSARTGGKYLIDVVRQGDLITKTALRIKLPSIESTALSRGTDQIAWVRKLGHAILKKVEITIGSSPIDSHIGLWLDILWELTHHESAARGYRELIGDVPELTKLRGVEVQNGVVVEPVVPEYVLFIPFQFWFCRNYGLAIPLIALQYHQIRFNIELENINKLLVWTGASPTLLNQSLSFVEAGILFDYVYLDIGERKKFAQHCHEYLIEQVQNVKETIQASPQSSSSINKIKLNFNHPTKELVWAFQIGAYNGDDNVGPYSNRRGQFLCYTHDDNKWDNEALDDACKNLVEGCVFVNPEGLTGLTGSVNSFDVHRCSNISNTGYNNGHRFTVEIKNVSGVTIGNNFDTYNERNITVFVYNTLFTDVDFHLFGSTSVDLARSISSAHVVVTHNDGEDISIECVECTHTLNLNDVSIPIGDFVVDNRSSSSAEYNVHKDVYVTQTNYGLRLDGRGNPVRNAVIELNNHPRFTNREGKYFNMYQPLNHHTHTPCDGINVYSFAIAPEKHQPSGTTNLSRIDSTILCIEFADQLRANRQLKLDLGRDSKLYIFAWSYNVLRVVSGMAGLAYSN